ncbi:hypothetical protein ACWDAZ_13080 [Streptomyces sp. NPDC001215]
MLPRDRGGEPVVHGLRDPEMALWEAAATRPEPVASAPGLASGSLLRGATPLSAVRRLRRPGAAPRR